MDNNILTRFEESAFGPMLQQMASGKGFVNAASDAGSICLKISLFLSTINLCIMSIVLDPIDCSDGSICHLAWLGLGVTKQTPISR